MTATNKGKKPVKYDIKAMVGDLSKDEPPKSLQECLHEAGGFPFAVRAIIALTNSDGRDLGDNVGDEIRITRGPHPTFPEGFVTDTRSKTPGCSFIGRRFDVKRWQLLGHKT